MRPKTSSLAARVRGVERAEDQLACLSDQYPGETAYVLSCGPSLTDVWSPALVEFLRDKLVIAVKQAYTLAPAAADFHLYNRCRYQEYSYQETSTIRLAVELGAFEHHGDIRLPFCAHPEQKWLHSVLFSRAFDEWALSATTSRNWGPGLMLELGIFLPVHLGCRRVVFLGWDMSPIDAGHFHDLSYTPNQLQEHVVVANALPQFVPHLVDWYARHGLEPFLCSPRSSVPLPQIPVADLMANREDCFEEAARRHNAGEAQRLRVRVDALERLVQDREAECRELRLALQAAS